MRSNNTTLVGRCGVVVVLATVFTVFLSNTVNVDAQRACFRPKKVGRCRAAFQRFYFDPTRRVCRSFVYGGCGGNSNNFRTMEACRRRCFLVHRIRDACNLPPRTGPCRASMTRYYYDSNAGRCQSFTYGGCRGNRNRFDSLEECTQTCG